MKGRNQIKVQELIDEANRVNKEKNTSSQTTNGATAEKPSKSHAEQAEQAAKNVAKARANGDE